MKEKKKKMLTLAFGIALLPPVWAVLSGHIGVTVGSVALICAGVYTANGGKIENAPKISLGFLAGDLWAVLAVAVMEFLPWNPDAELYATLFVMGGIAVLIAESLPKIFFTPAWLCGWAIGLTIMGPMKLSALGTMPLQIGAAMLVGVFYVGIGVDFFQKILLGKFRNHSEAVQAAESGNK